VRGGAPEVLAQLRTIKQPFAVCFEASTGYGYWYENLSQVARQVQVAHPGQTRLIFKSKRKNDRIDAQKLATLLFLDQVPTVHVPTADVRSWRALIEYRQRLVRERTRAKNRLRALLRRLGIPAPYRLWNRAGFAWLAALDIAQPADAVQRDLLLDEICCTAPRLRRVEQALATIAQGEPGVALLQTIPGVGIRTAEAMMAAIDDPRRFRTNKTIGAYLGLIPCLDVSADTRRYGHITREGPATARHLLVEAAWQGIRRSPRIRAYFERIKKDNPERRKIALVATAHYLARVMLAMLTTGESWRPENPAARVA
jgi:transposase